MNKFLIEKNNLKVSKITIKDNNTILETPLGLFIIKENENIKTYDYLLSRGFNYLPKIIDYDNNSILFKYIDGIDYDINEKALDYVRLLSLLHNKTSYFINDENEYKNIYNSFKKKINDLNVYYDRLITDIENKEYYSPSEYFLLRNSSIIFSSLNYSNSLLESFYGRNKSNIKKRVSTLYNNYNLNDLIKTTEDIYLTNFNNSYVDRPIYDLVNFYNKYYLDFDFYYLIKTYEKVFPLTNNEIDLFLLLVITPGKVILSDNIKDMSKVKNIILKVYKGLDLLKLKKEEDSSAHEKKDNK